MSINSGTSSKYSTNSRYRNGSEILKRVYNLYSLPVFDLVVSERDLRTWKVYSRLRRTRKSSECWSRSRDRVKRPLMKLRPILPIIFESTRNRRQWPVELGPPPTPDRVHQSWPVRRAERQWTETELFQLRQRKILSRKVQGPKWPKLHQVGSVLVDFS